ncbi:MAG: PIG-L family deacetylase [Promicromonosporaceae bacterium]|nr:PIG-L family deacetylase [Promicromonosporaceae bacterium]
MATVVCLHAHPDDEALLTGGWIAQRAAAGDRVVLVVATDGEAGLAAGGPGAALADRRVHELDESARALGVARVVRLGYGDSGMADRPSDGASRFVDVPLGEAADAVVAVLDEEDADLLTGYDDRGGYGHPDHLKVHVVAREAQLLARRRPVLWEATMDRTWLVRVLHAVRPLARVLPGLTVPGDDVFTARADIAHAVDVRDQLPAKRAALAAHASQASGGVRTVAILLALPPWLARRVIGTEWFSEVP